MHGENGRPTFPTRDRAFELLAAFAPRAGRAYAAQRNFDHGPDDRSNVSTLSRYVRHRAITEREVLAGILAQQTPQTAFKSIQEVMWRTYWKGWLEAHPSVWTAYLESLPELLAGLDADAGATYRRAVAGDTGIAAFDAWARELIEHGYLHNHARMWFASIWIFTLELPWELGADFFMRHLLDGDPAANTLSWRWVGGRQTIGKTYLATRRNILHYTENRLDPGLTIARSARAEKPVSRPLPEELRLPPGGESAGDALLVLHDDDLGFPTLPYDSARIRSVAGVSLAALRSPGRTAAPVRRFVETLAAEASAGAAAASGARDEGVLVVESLEETVREIDWIVQARRLERVAVPYGAVGPGREFAAALGAACRGRGIAFDVLLRDYDAVTWPNAGRGFFQFGKQIPAMLRRLELVAN